VYGFRWERWSALLGVLFVALFVLGMAIVGNVTDTPAKVEAWYADTGHQTRAVAAFFLVVGSGLAFLSFLGTLRDMLVRAETGPGTLSALVFGPGLVFVALVDAGFAGLAAPAVVAHDEDFKLDPNTANMFQDAGWLLIVAGVMTAAITVLSASMAALRTAVLPAWLGWSGLIVGVLMLFAFFWVPILIFLAWVLTVSLVLVVAAWRVRGAPPPTTTAVG
jgi:hypothetical protein